jgi:CheY-like chemotaxis protein
MPLVILSSIGRTELGALMRPGGTELGNTFAAVLTKPVKPAQLMETLVRVCTDAAPAAPARLGPPTVDAHLGERFPLRVLLAEDNPINQKVELRMLERVGYRADAVASGTEALEALERRPYDVVLMDVQMPEMDGLEATRRLRAQFAGTRRPQVIAMTANAMEGDREACLAAGMDDYVAKPVRLEALAAALERAARRLRVEPRGAAPWAPSSTPSPV